jgi:tetraacyldisaccharide 4'-kinase
MVDPNGNASEYGDEPLLIARKLGVPTVVGENRYDAGRIAEQEFQSQLHLLDDGFQHRSLARDFDIVLMTAADFEDRLLPIGRLREPLTSLRRADAIVLPQGFAIEHAALKNKLLFRMTRELSLATVPQSPIAFCGLARPQQFFAQVRAAGVEPVAEVVFPDHHAYDKNDVERLLKLRSELGAHGFLTTEKDAINLGDMGSHLDSLTVAGLKVTLNRPAELLDTILTRIAGRKPGS